MNKKTTYEITITEKLQQLPIPDMADAIWSRIEKQLDVDMPTDNSNPGSSKPSNSIFNNGWIKWGLNIFIVALVTIFLLDKNKEPSDAIPDPATAIPALKPAVDSGYNGNPPGGGLNIPLRRPEVKEQTGVVSEPGIDTAQTNLVNSAIMPDDSSVNYQAGTNRLPIPARQDSVPPKKKTKGVTGITQDDYRIVPAKKDST